MNRLPHLDSQYEAELRTLYGSMVKTGLQAEGMIRDGVRAFLERDPALARSVMATDREVNRLEVDTDELAVKLMVRRAPVGEDLRLVMCALKVVVDMERIGDLAGNIAKRYLEIQAAGPGLEPTAEMFQLAQSAVDITRRAMEALQRRDAAAARALKTEDVKIDDLNRAVFQQMIVVAKDHADQLERAIAYTSIARYLERVADHAVNIAEMVVFLAEGKVIRHAPPD
jgi:phosphate transport system protein